MFEIEERFAFSYPRRGVAVIGWCCFDDRTAVDDLFIVCEGRRTPALSGLLRPDISRQLNAPSLTALRIPLPVSRIRSRDGEAGRTPGRPRSCHRRISRRRARRGGRKTVTACTRRGFAPTLG